MKTKIIVALLVALGLAQLVPVSRGNPPVEAEIQVGDEVRAILRESCYDCHSNETRWPWYASVAPVSWLIAHDVEEAREHLNFSTWGAYDAKKRAELREEAWEKIDEGEMPLWFYVTLHPAARLGDEDKRVLHAWATGGG